MIVPFTHNYSEIFFGGGGESVQEKERGVVCNIVGGGGNCFAVSIIFAPDCRCSNPGNSDSIIGLYLCICLFIFC